MKARTKISYLNGVRLRWGIMAAAEKLIGQESVINELNYFPVPDKDTGTNMASTFKNILIDLKNFQHSSLEKMGEKIAESALLAARGNSGAIIAQFFCGLHEAFTGHHEMNTSQFCQAITLAEKRSREVLLNPVEGTIITVIRSWEQFLGQMNPLPNDFYSLIDLSLPVAQEALRLTGSGPRVGKFQTGIDAGAQGFITLLEGVRDIMNDNNKEAKNNLRRFESSHFSQSLQDSCSQPDNQDPSNISHDEMDSFVGNEKDIEFRYCTECHITPREAASLQRLELQESLKEWGDSLIVAGDKKMIHLHIHTNDPEGVFEIVREKGILSKEKVDDMIQQFRNGQMKAEGRGREKLPALVVDSSCDLPTELMEKYNIHQVPTHVFFGEENYMDKITLKSSSFYRKLLNSPHHPRTSCPTASDFNRCYRMVMKHYSSAFSLHIPKNLSGTFQQALHSAQNISPHIQVLDCQTASVGMGLLALEMAKSIELGQSHEEVLGHFQRGKKNLKVFLLLNTLKYLVKGGRLNKTTGAIGNMIQLRPILSITPEGEIKVLTQALGMKAARKKILTLVEKSVAGKSNIKFGLAHGDASVWSSEMANCLKTIYPQASLFSTHLSPGLGVHAGPGSLCVAVLTDSQLN